MTPPRKGHMVRFSAVEWRDILRAAKISGVFPAEFIRSSAKRRYDELCESGCILSDDLLDRANQEQKDAR